MYKTSQCKQGIKDQLGDNSEISKELDIWNTYKWDKVFLNIQKAIKQTILTKKKKHPWWNNEYKYALKRCSEAQSSTKTTL